ncbi:hypothetical protein CDAR_565181 [Caerostris darwini]|uniref:Uncharacterized protein n=1 Tax=Caerostris darwini TaxID=1538125 RepID=A0AAV4TSU2_9ARAC|nr:hypothetical protein CDAR_565181 [Caerostris darwini]
MEKCSSKNSATHAVLISPLRHSLSPRLPVSVKIALPGGELHWCNVHRIFFLRARIRERKANRKVFGSGGIFPDSFSSLGSSPEKCWRSPITKEKGEVRKAVSKFGRYEILRDRNPSH